MKHLTFEEYKQALEGAGPKLMENILDRATEDPCVDLDQYCVLVEMMEGAV